MTALLAALLLLFADSLLGARRRRGAAVGRWPGTRGRRPAEHQDFFAAIKSKLRRLARQVARHNVVINNILPGPFLTDRLRSGAMATAKQRNVPVDDIIAERAAGTPTGRVGIPAEFGDACAFLCSANIGFIVGHNLLLDGGNFNSSIA